MTLNTGIPNASSTREDKRVELRERMDRARLLVDAYTALANEIDVLSASSASFVPIWNEVSHRLRKDATMAQREHDKAQERLMTLNNADVSAERWTPKRSHEGE